MLFEKQKNNFNKNKLGVLNLSQLSVEEKK
jgi:hypothetical protein